MGVAAGGDAVNGFRDICEIGFYFLPDFREDFRAVGVEKRPQFGHKIGNLRGFQSAAKRPNLDVAEVKKY